MMTETAGMYVMWRFVRSVLEGAAISQVQAANIESVLRHRADYRSASWGL